MKIQIRRTGRVIVIRVREPAPVTGPTREVSWVRDVAGGTTQGGRGGRRGRRCERATRCAPHLGKRIEPKAEEGGSSTTPHEGACTRAIRAAAAAAGAGEDKEATTYPPSEPRQARSHLLSEPSPGADEREGVSQRDATRRATSKAREWGLTLTPDEQLLVQSNEVDLTTRRAAHPASGPHNKKEDSQVSNVSRGIIIPVRYFSNTGDRNPLLTGLGSSDPKPGSTS